MHTHHRISHKLNNRVQSFILLGSMALLLALLGWLIAGPVGLALAVVGGLLLPIGQRVSPQLLFKMYGARPVTRRHAPALLHMVQTLAQRAELPAVPQVYYVPSSVMNAFTVGRPEQAAIGVTDGLIRRLNQRELLGVLAHEMSHLSHHDTWVMGLADVVSRLTSLLSLIGQVLLILALPMVLLGDYQPPWLLLLLLIFAPTLSALLQLALSRTREFDADLAAVHLTGDPVGLASALEKLEYYQKGFFERILMPGRQVPDPSLLRTHPATEQRIARLLSLAQEPAWRHATPLHVSLETPQAIFQGPQIMAPPRRRITGVWF